MGYCVYFFQFICKIWHLSFTLFFIRVLCYSIFPNFLYKFLLFYAHFGSLYSQFSNSHIYVHSNRQIMMFYYYYCYCCCWNKTTDALKCINLTLGNNGNFMTQLLFDFQLKKKNYDILLFLVLAHGLLWIPCWFKKLCGKRDYKSCENDDDDDEWWASKFVEV